MDISDVSVPLFLNNLQSNVEETTSLIPWVALIYYGGRKNFMGPMFFKPGGTEVYRSVDV